MTEIKDTETPPKRRHKRYKTSLHIAVANHYSLLFETAVQISRGGMLLRTHGLPILNQVLEFRFFLPNKDFVFVKGEIVYRLKVDGLYYAGIRFIEGENPELTRWLEEDAAGINGENIL